MKVLLPLFAVIALVVLAIVGVKGAHLNGLFGIVIPYAAFVIFLGGMIARVTGWARSPVPFKIPSTCGQQKSLPWIKADNLESPHNTTGVIGRMALEVFFFRSLFRNTQADYRGGDQKLTYGSEKFLWAAGLAFHWTFLYIFLRHLRFFLEPIPFFVPFLEGLDGLLQIGVPRLFMTDLVILVAVTFLVVRRLMLPQVRYISLPADYFPLFLILGIAISGILMRYFIKVDLVGVKALTMSLVTLSPRIPEGPIGSVFYVHLFLISVLFAYFPFSKLVHMGGVFLSPTRNQANNSREVRHVNPWNYPVKHFTYEEYEDEFREVMVGAGLPVEKQAGTPAETAE
jgi:nitrate reductase gamma subunit